MRDYTLYYWPAPFRGQFVRAVLAHVEADWDEAEPDEIVQLMEAEPADQPVPFIGPPVLVDHAAQVSLAQMPAILAYLGDTYGLIPGDLARAALTHKVVADASDVLYEMTRYHGAQVWTQAAWDSYRPRLTRWMAVFEAHGRRSGLTPRDGTLLGTEEPGLADLTAHVLWGTMTAKLPALRPLLDSTAPAVAGLSDRIGQQPQLADLRRRSDAAFGDTWCGGEIEASLRAVL
ncbi:glutathione S-transferase [Rhodovibrio sodomensis]|uniref:Glutathione S-transferase n=1 Tax=Rhodovibrio sodomensis TaxID=1088 RepID=A0ABS1DEI8_9PROT|nr:glutathione S-transferase [Rhodovibrio sodomensis]MBK1668865.1 glutathione S-transferase [Rhodovibrio sodomensis]